MFSDLMRTSMQCGQWALTLQLFEEMQMLMLDANPAAYNMVLSS